MRKTAKKILILEDEQEMRKILRDLFREGGYATLEARDGDEALRLLCSYAGIGVVVLDIMLPKKSGLEIFEAIRKDFPAVKVIVSSVYPAEEQQFLISEADDYYYKTETATSLIDKVDRLLNV